MVNIEKYISCLIARLKDRFGDRLLYVGLQGSYLRGEATESSDLDIMVIIDELSVSDLNAYRVIIESMEYSEKSCARTTRWLYRCKDEMERLNALHDTLNKKQMLFVISR